jgi:hypothetical protein
VSTDTSKKGLVLIILQALTGLSKEQILQPKPGDEKESGNGFGGRGYLLGRPRCGGHSPVAKIGGNKETKVSWSSRWKLN